jgi:hypothetical protein
MKKPEVGTPGAFRSSAKRFTENRNRKPSDSEALEIIENAKRRQEKVRPKKSARTRRQLAQVVKSPIFYLPYFRQ